MLFDELGLHPDLVRAVKAMNFEKPTPIQEAAIPLALEGRDVMGCAQTGGGKTAAFALPVLHHLLKESRPGIRVLVLVPTRELAAQVETTFRDVGRFSPFKTAVVIGGVGFSPQVSAANRATILVATPGRLLDHLRQGSFRLDKVEQLILDEADRMLDMGFLPDIKAVISQLPRNRQTQLFSATLAPEVERIAAFALKEPKRVEITKPTTVAEGISQILYPVVQSQKAGLLLELLKSTEMKSVLVFSRTKHGADKLAKKLTSEGYTVGLLHGNRSQNQRTAAMDAFRQGRLRIMVATDIAARGIDVRGISHVVNFDVPRFPEDYVHRVGRTARAYGVGDAITFMDPSLETGHLRDIERFTGIVFPRAVLPDFQYNAPPRQSAQQQERRPQSQNRQQPRHGDRRPQQSQHRDEGRRRDGNRDGNRNGNRDGNRGGERDGNRRPGQDFQSRRNDRPGHNGQRRPEGQRPVDGNRREQPSQSGRDRDNRRDDRRDQTPNSRPAWDRPSTPPMRGNDTTFRKPKGYW
jgi:ATP-dependent RNA helicase RhlE